MNKQTLISNWLFVQSFITIASSHLDQGISKQSWDLFYFCWSCFVIRPIWPFWSKCSKYAYELDLRAEISQNQNDVFEFPSLSFQRVFQPSLWPYVNGINPWITISNLIKSNICSIKYQNLAKNWTVIVTLFFQ